MVRRLGWPDERVVVNVQGDEPLLPPALVSQAAGLLDEDRHAGMATLVTPIVHGSEWDDPNVVKVVTDRSLQGHVFQSRTYPLATGWRATGSGGNAARGPVCLPGLGTAAVCRGPALRVGVAGAPGTTPRALAGYRDSRCTGVRGYAQGRGHGARPYRGTSSVGAAWIGGTSHRGGVASGASRVLRNTSSCARSRRLSRNGLASLWPIMATGARS